MTTPSCTPKDLIARAGMQLPDLFVQQAELHPDRLALVVGGEEWTYAELRRAAAGLAQALAASGVSPGDRVVCSASRSYAAVAAQIGVMQAGAVYVPVDVDAPGRWKSRLAEICSPAAVLCPSPEHRAFEGIAPRILLVDQLAPADPSPLRTLPDGDAYILFTSGSTGEPKAVCIPHKAILATTLARFTHYEHPVSSYLVVSPLTFDSAMNGLWWTLASGGTIHLAPPDLDGTLDLIRAAMDGRMFVSHMSMTPSLYSAALSGCPGSSTGPRVTIVAGEVCSDALVEGHYRKQLNSTLFNEYGPTECAVWCAGGELRAGERVTVGYPISCARIVIADPDGRHCPVGQPGEVWIGGEGLARGYLDDDALTGARFVERLGRRYYRSGDEGYLLDDGRLVVTGRLDRELKVRGHRVDPSVVERVLLEHEDVAEAFVTLEDGRLVAHVVRLARSDAVPRLH